MNKMITRIIALILTLGLFTGCASTLPQPDMDLDLLDEIQQRGTLIIGTEGTYSPNSYHDESGTLVGFDVEVAQAVAAKLGVEAQFVEAEWDSLFAGMDAGRIDVVGNEVEYSEQRAQKYDFSQPYTYVHGALLVAADNAEIQSFDDLKGRRSAQNLTSSWGLQAESYGAELVSVDTLAQCIDLLNTGRADATLNAETAFYDYLNQHPEAPVKIVALSDSTTSSLIPVRKDNAKLLQAINEALEYADDRESFIENMEYEGYEVNWVPTRKHITFTCPNGRKCRDSSLHDETFLKENLEKLFAYRQATGFCPGTLEPDEGWMGELAAGLVQLGRALEREADLPQLPTPPVWTDSKLRRREALKKLAMGQKLSHDTDQQQTM